MSTLKYALVKGDIPVLVPVSRRCEPGAFHLALGDGGPAGTLEREEFDGDDLFQLVRVPRDLGPLVELSLKSLKNDGVYVHRIHVGESWDPFLGPPEIQIPVLDAVDALCSAGIEVLVRTRADLTRSVIDRFAEHRGRIQVELPFVSMRPDVASTWEPGAATPGERLRLARSLTSHGIPVRARVEPMLPLINDTGADIEEFCVAFAGTGIGRIGAAYLQLTPGYARILNRSLSRMQRDILKGCFEGRSWKQIEGCSVKLLPAGLRERGLRRFAEEARSRGLAFAACGCADGDVMPDSCYAPGELVTRRDEQQRKPAVNGQLDFFGRPE